MTGSAPPWDDELPADLAEDAAAHILAAAPGQRAAMVDALVAAHPEHAAGLRRVALLLAGAEHALTAAFRGDHDPLPAAIGDYRVLRRLGEGAFGTVFLCAQDRPVRREVAVKLLRPGAGDRYTLDRFAAERQLLAALSHPTITQVFDAGELTDGRPYFVMEHVAGQPISAYCASRRLALPDRLRLFIALSHGVEHAHRRGVVHRDLKPANVLVVDSESGPLPKIIDFGIAKALHAQAEQRLHTDAGRVVGTPGYMSPEQAAGEVGAIDARSDVFALGVMLYELMTGELPWPRGAAATDAEPVRPSTRVAAGAMPGEGAAPAHRRQLASALRGDLDWITLKALAREPARRYQRVPELTDDLERHLRGAPVTARPPSTAYRLRKFVGRNRVAVLSSAAAGAAIGLAAALVYASGQQARAAADSSFASATRVLDQVRARVNDDRIRRAPQSDVTRGLLLEDTRQSYAGLLAARPDEVALREQHCRTLLDLSDVQWRTGQFARAVELAEQARGDAELLRAAAPEAIAYRSLLANAHRKKGRALTRLGQNDQALTEFVAATGDLEACWSASPVAYALPFASALRELGTLRRILRAPDHGIPAFRRSAAVLEEALGLRPDDETIRHDLLFARAGLAEVLVHFGSIEEAAAELARAATLLLQETVEPDRATMLVRGLTGMIAFQRGDHDAAIQPLQDAMAAAERWQRREPQQLEPLIMHERWASTLGWAYDRKGAWELASAMFRRAIELCEEMVLRFPDDPMRLVHLADSLRDFARELWERFRRADLAEAVACARRTLEVEERAAKTVHESTRPAQWLGMAQLALILDSAGQPDAALWDHVAAALPAGGERLAPLHQDRLVEAYLGLARWRLAAGDQTAAAAALDAARGMLARGQGHRKRAVDLGTLAATLAVARQQHAAAAQEAAAILAARPTWLGKRHAGDCLFAAWQCAAHLAELDPAIASDYRDRAAALYRAAIAELDPEVTKDPADPWPVVPWGFAHVRLAQIEADRGDTATARRLLAAALPTVLAMREAAHAEQWNQEAAEAGVALAHALGVATERR